MDLFQLILKTHRCSMEYPFAFIMRECKDAPADAVPQLIAYYVHYIKTITHSEETEHLQRSDTRFPTLGLVDTGATIDSSTYIFLYSYIIIRFATSIYWFHL